MKVEVISFYDVLKYYKDDFPLAVSYINRDKMYTCDWVHFTADDNTNDAFVYLMPGHLHNIKDSLWVSVLEVRTKGTGFGSQVIEALKIYAKKLGFKSISLHALDAKAKMFYHKNGFGDNGEDEILFLS